MLQASELFETSEQITDFGQKSDLCVRIREILRNYPEGLSILKELLQNADDAGARVVKFCVVSAYPKTSSTSNLSSATSVPSLIAYNDAVFSDNDFTSIQRIGDSIKREEENGGKKTGRFGVGVNSVYHLTNIPMFASRTKLVIFDVSERIERDLMNEDEHTYSRIPRKGYRHYGYIHY